MKFRPLISAVFAFALVAAACGSDDAADDTTTDDEGTQQTTASDSTDEDSDSTDEDSDSTDEDSDSTDEDSEGTDEDSEGTDEDSEEEAESPFNDEGRSMTAAEATIVIDGDASDWADVDGLEMTLAPISDEDLETKEAVVKVAHDGDNIYFLFQIEDDYDWIDGDPHASAAAAVDWVITDGAGEGMGATDADRDTSLGMVDLWHLELDCAAGTEGGGAVSGPGADHDPGNDEACNFDDEFATNPDERHDDVGDGAENSLLGVWTHSSDTIGEDGTWTFEVMRPFQTGDAQDAQFEIGSPALMGVAYWDADTGPDGWEPEYHVMSANQGWITVNFE
ncbi:MAG: hypothetical protein GY724_15820 [Actinomycetia bacterium]|nr:hypothetical protein [Actinomycetes bacterium]